jgi:hypothetical protein
MQHRHLVTILCALALTTLPATFPPAHAALTLTVPTAHAAAVAFTAAAPASATAQQATEVVFTDNFDQLPSGILMGTVGAEAEYHYIRATSPTAGWGTAVYRSEITWQRAWRGIETDGRRAVKQFMKNPPSKYAECHPMLACDADGAFLWTDYTVKARFASHDTTVLSGINFRYVTNRNNYRLQVIKNQAQILLVNDGKAFRVPDEKILAETPFPCKAGEYIAVTLKVAGDTFTATLENTATGATVTLNAADTTYRSGKIALVSDAPATYTDVKVLMTAPAKTAWLAAKKTAEAAELALQSQTPKPVLWKKITTAGFGIGRNIRFGNLLGNGEKQIVIAQVRHLGPKDTNAEISCVTAIDLNGKKLWQNGTPDPWNSHLTNDVAIQCHDIDGDGRDEVIYTMHRELIIADGATGKVKRKCPTPERLGFDPNGKFKQNQWHLNILGDSIHFCDVRGTGRKADILIKDRYQAFWLYDENLNPLWSAQCNTGHYPCALDTDGDGKDEIFIGYSLYAHDGKQLWTHDEKYGDHDDGLAFVRLHPDDNHYTIFMAGSDEGVILLDQDGRELKHHYLGHVQNPGVAKFDPADPGLQAVTVNFWGNQGIIHFFDSKGNITHVMEPSHHGSVCLPVNWTGEPAELVMLSPNYEDGGLFDYKGRRAVRIPCDGHPEMTYHALDLTGDCRDELVIWDENEIWIYTQDDNGRKPGKLYQPVRDYLMNDSNYRAYVSLPPDYPAKLEKKK